MEMYGKFDKKDSRVDDIKTSYLEVRVLKTGSAPDVGQAPAGHWETGHLAGAGADHHPAQARHQTPQHSDKHLSSKH